MRELAVALGRPLLFPVRCRYCDRSIWLFASPDGGFAIFDDIGQPWPKHECWGIKSLDPRYVHTDPRFSRAFGQFPVPDQVAIVTPSAGTRVTGVVVRHEPGLELFGIFQIVLLCVDVAYRVLVDKSFPIGTALTGVVETARDGRWLRGVQPLPIPGRDAVGVARETDHQAAQPTPVASLSAQMLWTLQADIVALRKCGRHAAADAIAVAVEAVVAGQILTGTAALAAAVLSPGPGEASFSDLTARHVRILFLTLRDVGLEVCARRIADSLSVPTMRALDPKTVSIVQEIAAVGQLLRKGQSYQELRRYFARLLGEEELFREKTAMQFPMVREYVEALGSAI